MPELQAVQTQLSEDWIAKLTEMVADLKARRGAHRPRPTRARVALELAHAASPPASSWTQRLICSPRALAPPVRHLAPRTVADAVLTHPYRLPDEGEEMSALEGLRFTVVAYDPHAELTVLWRVISSLDEA